MRHLCLAAANCGPSSARVVLVAGRCSCAPLLERCTHRRPVKLPAAGRYSRYREVSGRGRFKTVFKGFDEKQVRLRLCCAAALLLLEHCNHIPAAALLLLALCSCCCTAAVAPALPPLPCVFARLRAAWLSTHVCCRAHAGHRCGVEQD